MDQAGCLWAYPGSDNVGWSRTCLFDGDCCLVRSYIKDICWNVGGFCLLSSCFGTWNSLFHVCVLSECECECACARVCVCLRKCLLTETQGVASCRGDRTVHGPEGVITERKHTGDKHTTSPHTAVSTGGWVGACPRVSAHGGDQCSYSALMKEWLGFRWTVSIMTVSGLVSLEKVFSPCLLCDSLR